MSEATQTQTLEQTLNKTDLGHVIFENKNIFFAALIAVLAGVTGFSLWKQSQKSAALENSVKVFEFQKNVWADVKIAKNSPAELVKSFEALSENVRNAPVMLPLVLEMAKFLYEKGNFAEAEAILSKVKAGNDNSVGAFFLGMQRSAVLEKLGKTTEAIAVLEVYAKMKVILMPAKVSLELGRLNLKAGNKNEAKTQLDYVISTFPNEAEAKIAKLYLSQVAQ